MCHGYRAAPTSGSPGQSSAPVHMAENPAAPTAAARLCHDQQGAVGVITLLDLDQGPAPEAVADVRPLPAREGAAPGAMVDARTGGRDFRQGVGGERDHPIPVQVGAGAAGGQNRCPGHERVAVCARAAAQPPAGAAEGRAKGACRWCDGPVAGAGGRLIAGKGRIGHLDQMRRARSTPICGQGRQRCLGNAPDNTDPHLGWGKPCRAGQSGDPGTVGAPGQLHRLCPLLARPCVRLPRCPAATAAADRPARDNDRPLQPRAGRSVCHSPCRRPNPAGVPPRCPSSRSPVPISLPRRCASGNGPVAGNGRWRTEGMPCAGVWSGTRSCPHPGSGSGRRRWHCRSAR